MAMLTKTPDKSAPRAKDTFEKPSFQDCLWVLIPGVALAVIMALLNISGLVGGESGLLGGRGGPLEKVKDVHGALMFGGMSLIIGIFVSVLVLSRTSQGKRKRYWHRTFTAYLYLSPSVVILLMFTYISIIYGLYVSLHKFGLGQFSGAKAWGCFLLKLDLWGSTGGLRDRSIFGSGFWSSPPSLF